MNESTKRLLEQHPLRWEVRRRDDPAHNGAAWATIHDGDGKIVDDPLDGPLADVFVAAVNALAEPETTDGKWTMTYDDDGEVAFSRAGTQVAYVTVRDVLNDHNAQAERIAKLEAEMETLGESLAFAESHIDPKWIEQAVEEQIRLS